MRDILEHPWLTGKKLKQTSVGFLMPISENNKEEEEEDEKNNIEQGIQLRSRPSRLQLGKQYKSKLGGFNFKSLGKSNNS